MSGNASAEMASGPKPACALRKWRRDELARLATWAERRLGPKCKRPLKSGLDQSGETGAVVLRRTAIYQRPDASIGDKSLEIVGSIAKEAAEKWPILSTNRFRPK